MKRFGRYLILIAAVIFLSGCVQIDVDCGVDSSFQAYLRYYIAVDTSDLNVFVKQKTAYEIGQ